MKGPQADGPYQTAVAPVPSKPPVAVRVVELPLQIRVVPVMAVGATENVLKVTTTSSEEGPQGALAIVQRKV